MENLTTRGNLLEEQAADADLFMKLFITLDFETLKCICCKKGPTIDLLSVESLQIQLETISGKQRLTNYNIIHKIYCT